MKFSIVTISYNQARFLEQCIRSVLDQDYHDVEYILVDPGSTDGSRQIIERYRRQIDKIILEPDDGPADGLNKGFGHANGGVFGFLNSDDYLLPGALSTTARAFQAAPGRDVLSGHALIVDAEGKELNRFYSRSFSATRSVYGAATIAQQSTFFRATTFKKTSGFNVNNKIAWDGELWIDLALSGASFGNIPGFLSAFRVYEGSITGSGKHATSSSDYQIKMFEKVKGREWGRWDKLVRLMYKCIEYISHPKVAKQRLIAGRTIRRQTK